MAALTNSYHNCELLNLGHGPNGRGPFVIRQEGTPPGSMTFQPDRFLLRKDGTWVFVRTPGGVQGWVNSTYLAWA